MSDLEACYDRQLPNTAFMVEESTGANREEIKLVPKALPCCKIFLETSHGVRKDCYGGINELLGGTGQDNVFLGSLCRDVSCFTFKETEKKRIGIIIITSKSDNK